MPQATNGHSQHVTVPLRIEHNRPFVDFTLKGVDGSTHTARFWIDTGGGAFLISEALARKLGMSWEEVIESDEGRFAPCSPPALRLAGMPIRLEHTQALVVLDQPVHMTPGIFADGLICGSLLAQYHVIFDFPHHQFTLATPGTLPPQGAPLGTPIHPESGFPRLEVQIDGQTYGMLLDTGASHTMISRPLLETFTTAHPDWSRADGAIGTANMGDEQADTKQCMVRLATCTWGPYQLADVSVVSRDPGVFEERLSPWMTSPIVGALGGNVLRCFRVEIDYAGQTTYLEQYATPTAHDMDLIGLTLLPQRDGSYRVLEVATGGNAQEVSEQIQVGDILLYVDQQEIYGLSLASAVDALRGVPGQMHTLQLERMGQHREIQVPVRRVL
ncbi:aspartyl protease family protein [Ktedonospora formicarum]|uniref:PDZ domain-containing protein n=1 Tax=Ktedonospora formicarum TaxID=2778364 RepID=A0A8J3IEI0_9CHLR|nr:aspartyl protease family protein [Ktedonospora formicarum]GHO51292.1 hypothetical protein KSX_94550 [Ktedonospora formicarum]